MFVESRREPLEITLTVKNGSASDEALLSRFLEGRLFNVLAKFADRKRRVRVECWVRSYKKIFEWDSPEPIASEIVICLNLREGQHPVALEGIRILLDAKPKPPETVSNRAQRP